MLYQHIGIQIRKRRREKGLTQQKLSEEAGITLSFLGHIERGTRRLSVDTLYKIAEALECSTDELLGTGRKILPAVTIEDHLRQALLLLEAQK